MVKTTTTHLTLTDAQSPDKRDLMVVVTRDDIGSLVSIQLFAEDRTFDRSWSNVMIELVGEEAEQLQDFIAYRKTPKRKRKTAGNDLGPSGPYNDTYPSDVPGPR